ncbi:pyruvate/2-oxoglutarate dehydrogenase complex dihydrolipoamide dehydrogenase (E3) component [Actinocorallia herbida]|uniref:Pyruvate/2-oxoglutarate dehydrogenase complex dihydrolipoamide dehydrogenase (E3) component n=1 Tax=Actinocorallia herbida TaxID=58109 RepID=A0A3N1CS50_9ACTN|nr:NAD(P)/FAD-dependent oxidoreductase [Actinocorallia herbida]ROO84142.1 pyruvate/2-oxoglutarate dehydrogenase complex dihydrolipoamide dehydrogenase (E3) component [Actinocorallia herbida]
MAEEADVVVVGLGPGGENAAGLLAEAGLSVTAVEAGLVGGECPYYGCVPTKMMVRAADALGEARRVPHFAGRAEVTADFGVAAKRVREQATDDWNDKVAADRLTGKGVTLVRGYGVLTGPREVTVGDRVIRGRKGVLVNPGTAPLVPPIDGLAGTPFWTNRDAVKATEAPVSLIVLGGGAIGVELAQVFARFGTKVTVVEGSERLVAPLEPEAGDLLRKVFEAEGITVHTGARASRVGHDGAEFTLELGGRTVRAERLLVATGRKTDLERLGVAAVGLDPKARSIPVDGRMRAGDGLWAIGDATGKGAFTHVSMYQSAIAVRDILGQDGPEADYHALPHVTFTDPEIGGVGLTEARAREAGIEVRTATTDIGASTRGWIHEAEGFVKLVADGDHLVGAAVAGPYGGEILGFLALAVQARVPVETLKHMIYAYPTFHRAIEATVAEL